MQDSIIDDARFRVSSVKYWLNEKSSCREKILLVVISGCIGGTSWVSVVDVLSEPRILFEDCTTSSLLLSAMSTKQVKPKLMYMMKLLVHRSRVEQLGCTEEATPTIYVVLDT